MRWALALLLVVLVPAAAGRELSIPWHDLRHFIQDRKVTVTAGQRSLRGRVTSISDDELILRSGKQTEPVPRASVSMIRVTRYDGVGRKAGALTGFVAGMIAGVVAFVAVGLNEVHNDSPGVRKAKTIAAWLGTWAGVTVGGWFIGRLFDREVLLIRPIPPAPQPRP